MTQPQQSDQTAFGPTPETIALVQQIVGELDPIQFYWLARSCGVMATIVDRALGGGPPKRGGAERQIWETGVKQLNIAQYLDQLPLVEHP